MVGIAALISVPFGILAAVYPGRIRPADRSWPRAVRFSAKVLTGLPSILAGVFAYGRSWCCRRGRLFGLGRRRGPVAADAADRHADGRGSDSHGAGHECAKRPSAWAATPTQVVWHVDAADGPAGHPDRRDAGRGPGRRRNGPAAVHRAVQQLLARSHTAS